MLMQLKPIFRRHFLTTDHLQTINQVVEKSKKYNMALYLAFVVYQKAFDSLHHQHILSRVTISNGYRKQICKNYWKYIRSKYSSDTPGISQKGVQNPGQCERDGLETFFKKQVGNTGLRSYKIAFRPSFCRLYIY